MNFKREFDLANGLRCFEIISSHHLELSSLEAQKAREKQKRKDFAQQGMCQLLPQRISLISLPVRMHQDVNLYCYY